MGTQKAIAEKIIDGEADDVLALKGNHETLHQAVIDYIDEQSANDFANVTARRLVTEETGHGRNGPGATTSRSVERRDGGKCHHIPISHQMDILDLHSMLNRVCLSGHSENFLFLI